jgi:hypothetical protein
MVVNGEKITTYLQSSRKSRAVIASCAKEEIKLVSSADNLREGVKSTSND